MFSYVRKGKKKKERNQSVHSFLQSNGVDRGLFLVQPASVTSQHSREKDVGN